MSARRRSGSSRSKSAGSSPCSSTSARQSSSSTCVRSGTTRSAVRAPEAVASRTISASSASTSRQPFSTRSRGGSAQHRQTQALLLGTKEGHELLRATAQVRPSGPCPRVETDVRRREVPHAGPRRAIPVRGARDGHALESENTAAEPEARLGQVVGARGEDVVQVVSHGELDEDDARAQRRTRAPRGRAAPGRCRSRRPRSSARGSRGSPPRDGPRTSHRAARRTPRRTSPRGARRHLRARPRASAPTGPGPWSRPVFRVDP